MLGCPETTFLDVAHAIVRNIEICWRIKGFAATGYIQRHCGPAFREMSDLLSLREVCCPLFLLAPGRGAIKPMTRESRVLLLSVQRSNEG